MIGWWLLSAVCPLLDADASAFEARAWSTQIGVSGYLLRGPRKEPCTVSVEPSRTVADSRVPLNVPWTTEPSNDVNVTWKALPGSSPVLSQVSARLPLWVA